MPRNPSPRKPRRKPAPAAEPAAVPVCRHDGCPRRVWAEGLCGRHWSAAHDGRPADPDQLDA